MSNFTYVESPVGLIEISGDEEYVHAVLFVAERREESSILPDVVKECRQQLTDYLAGKRKDFDLPLSQAGTAFQQRVWSQLMAIPCGKTISYMQLAKALGDPKTIRAAGTANGKNKLAIIVPCHRVIGSNGTLVGYAGGLNRKKWLLDHESTMSGALTLGL